MTRASVVLFLSACGIAIYHALIPDHWLPFVLMSRAQGWSIRRTTALTGLAGLLHVLVSIVVGGIAIGLGAESARRIAAHAERSLPFLAGVLLIVFGMVYGLWAHRREARAHGRERHGPGGSANVPHAHGHLLGGWLRGAVSGGALVVIIGISPCAVLVPILFAASAEGRGALAAAAAGFAFCTIGTIVGVTLLALRGMRGLEFPFLVRYGDLISGLTIAAIGVALVVLET